MLKDFSLSAAFVGILAAFVGYASTFALILTGLQAAGATADQAATGLMAVTLAMGVCGIISSLVARLPIGVAWSTPAAALLAGLAVHPSGGFSDVVGAFIVAGLLITASGLWRPLGRAVANIPAHLANAMIAGILFQLAVAPFEALGQSAVAVLPMILTWVVVSLVARTWAMPAALLAFVVTLILLGPQSPSTTLEITRLLPPLDFVLPTFDLAISFGLGVPLFVVTMAGQNIPGVAVMKASGYEINPSPWFTLTGISSILAAFWGGIAVNLAAITAAMMAGEQSHRDPKRRYWAGAMAGGAYVVFALLTSAVVALIGLAPLYMVKALAGLALIPAFMMAMSRAASQADNLDSAAITFIASASGVSLFGVSGAFWGLVLGFGVYIARQALARRAPSALE